MSFFLRLLCDPTLNCSSRARWGFAGHDLSGLGPYALQHLERSIGERRPGAQVIADGLELGVCLGEAGGAIGEKRVLAPDRVVVRMILQVFVVDRPDLRPDRSRPEIPRLPVRPEHAAEPEM